MGVTEAVGRRGAQEAAELKGSAFSRGEDPEEGCGVTQELPSDTRKVPGRVFPDPSWALGNRMGGTLPQLS